MYKPETKHLYMAVANSILTVEQGQELVAAMLRWSHCQMQQDAPRSAGGFETRSTYGRANMQDKHLFTWTKGVGRRSAGPWLAAFMQATPLSLLFVYGSRLAKLINPGI